MKVPVHAFAARYDSASGEARVDMAAFVQCERRGQKSTATKCAIEARSDPAVPQLIPINHLRCRCQDLIPLIGPLDGLPPFSVFCARRPASVTSARDLWRVPSSPSGARDDLNGATCSPCALSEDKITNGMLYHTASYLLCVLDYG